MTDYTGNTPEWDLYERGLDYKRKINLLATVDKNSRFYEDRQWDGVVSNGLPTPQYNLVAKTVDHGINQVMDNQVKMQFSVQGIDEETTDPQEQQLQKVAEILSLYSETTWERVKMDAMNEEGLLDGSLSGDFISFWFWNDEIDAGNGVMGDLDGELLDNVNYFPGNPNERRVQKQPYIILAFRRLVDEVKEEAKANGASEQDLELITSDSDYTNQAGDSGKIELDESGKTIVLLKLWKVKVPAQTNEAGEIVKEKYITIKGKKVCKSVTIREEWDLGLRRYPVALMNWKLKKNSCHGIPKANGIIPNQIYINKQAAMLQLNAMFNSFGKPIYDKTRIASWSNQLGTAIGVNGEITGAAGFIGPGNASPDAYRMLEFSIDNTKEMANASETALGDGSVTKTAAGIIALQKAAEGPLKPIKRRFYQYLEDVAQIWLDFWTSKYIVPRNISVTKQGVRKIEQLTLSDYRDVAFGLKIDIGPSNQWSEITTLQTLDNMRTNQIIDNVQYVERLPKGVIPKQQELLDDLQTGDLDKQVLWELMARFMESLPVEAQAQLQSMPPDAMEQQVKQMMLGQNQAMPMQGEVMPQDMGGQANVPNQAQMSPV